MGLRWPHDERPVIAIQVAAADVVEHLTGEPVARSSTAPMLKLDQNV